MLAINAARYGSPLASGYGSTDVLFAWAHVAPNLARYPRWLLETHTPFVLLAAAGPWRRGGDRHGIRGRHVRHLFRLHRLRRLVVSAIRAAGAACRAAAVDG